ncbi:MAG: phospho-sugar mutase [Chitinispirillia bacterium]|nr:phospho-sugar mutase [Chitinispirillia bacterium]MCL2242149.1 phospho-sugar mutase [Chitinispirillia bacterium]
MDTQALTKKANDYISLEKDPFFRGQVEKLLAEQDWAELNDRFYTDLEFGTGGLRGVIGGGFNRMNMFTVSRATQGLANYIVKAVPAGASAVIAYDSRKFSDSFALQAALVLAANGIKTYLFTSLRPTPELSFAVRQFGASAGIVVTASHNPSEYNGYKVYWNDGCQVTAPHDTDIIKEVLAVGDAVRVIEKDAALSSGKLVMVDKEVDVPFIDMVKSCAIRPKLLKDGGKDLKVVYTPLHGTGAVPVDTALREMGVNVIFVEEQREPDGDFPTVDYPNPEEASAMKLSLDLAQKVGADLVLGTDPDADRLGTAAPDNGKYVLITGNQLGALLADYIFSACKEMGKMPARPAFIKTIVTTELQRLIADDYGAASFDVLTGFKYIGEKIREFETGSEGYKYMFGGEESYGYLVNTSCRDKDAVSASTMTVEMALYHKSHGRTLHDQLRAIWKKYGYFREALISKTFKGESGLNTMKGLMEKLRKNPPALFAGQKVSLVKDYSDGTTFTPSANSREKNIGLPSSNVLQFVLEDGSIVTVRPSGTEPKIKFYISCRSERGMELDAAMKAAAGKIEAISKELNGIVDAA